MRPRAEAPVPYVGKRTSSGGGMFGGSGGGGGIKGQLEAMGRSGTLFAIIDATSTATASASWELYRKADGRQTDEDREVVPPEQHAAAALWARPNPFFTQSLLVETVQQHVDLAAEGYLLVVKKLGIPIELWPARPDRMLPVPSPTKYLAGWVYTAPDGEKVPFKVDEVIQIRKPSPLDMYRGLSAVSAIGTDLQASELAAQWNRNFFLNSAEPGGIIEVSESLGDDDFDQMVQRWNEQHRGVARAHRVAVLEHGKYVPRVISQKDMQFTELRHASRDTQMEAFRVSKTTLGISEDVNRAAAVAAEYQFSRHLTVPRLDRWEQALNVQLLPMFGETGKAVEFGYASPVDEDEAAANAERESKARTAQIYIDLGYSPPSVAEALQLPPMEYGTGEELDPERELLIKLVLGAPSLAPLILPLLGVELPDQTGAAPAADDDPKPPAPPAADDPEPEPDPAAGGDDA